MSVDCTLRPRMWGFGLVRAPGHIFANRSRVHAKCRVPPQHYSLRLLHPSIFGDLQRSPSVNSGSQGSMLKHAY